MLGRRSSVVAALAVGLVVGMGYPVVDLVLVCREPTSEACVWAKAYLPLTLGMSVPVVGGVVAGVLCAVLTWYSRRHSRDDAV